MGLRGGWALQAVAQWRRRGEGRALACPSVSQSVGVGGGGGPIVSEPSSHRRRRGSRTDRSRRTLRGAAVSKAVAGELSGGWGRPRGPRAEGRFRPVPFLLPRLGPGEQRAGGRRGTKVTTLSRRRNPQSRRRRWGGGAGPQGGAVPGGGGGACVRGEGGGCFSPCSETAAGLADPPSHPPPPNHPAVGRGGGGSGAACVREGLAAPSAPSAKRGRSPLLHTHRHTRSVSPPSRSGPFLSAPPPSPSLFPSFLLPFLPLRRLPPSLPPARTRCAEPGSCGCCCWNSCRGVSAFLYLRAGGWGGLKEGGAAAIWSRSPYKRVCMYMCVCLGEGRYRHPAPPSRTQALLLVQWRTSLPLSFSFSGSPR